MLDNHCIIIIAFKINFVFQVFYFESNDRSNFFPLFILCYLLDVSKPLLILSIYIYYVIAKNVSINNLEFLITKPRCSSVRHYSATWPRSTKKYYHRLTIFCNLIFLYCSILKSKRLELHKTKQRFMSSRQDQRLLVSTKTRKRFR